MTRWRLPRWGLVSAIASAVALLVVTTAVTRGFGAWAITSQNAGNTATTPQLIVPVVSSTHPSATSGTVSLTWTEPTTWVQGYDILRATTPTGTYTQIGSVSGAASTTYSDSTAAYNTQYYYEVAPYYDQWNPASAVDMALSLPPTSGTDATKSPTVTLSAAQLTSLSTTSGGGYTTASPWTATTMFGGSTVYGVSFPTSSNGWVVTQAGTIYHSTDGGETWAQQTSGTTQTLYQVRFVDASNGWAVGANGTILHTSNGGTTWTAQTSGTTQILFCPKFVDASNGWVVGANGTILHTSNGGTTWTAQTSGTTQILFGDGFINASNGWAVGASGTILHTSNGGTTWTAQTSGTTQTLYENASVDANNGWAVGASGTILHTSNGGATWTAQTSGTTQVLYGTAFVDANHGWAVGAGGTILATSNGGAAWTAQTNTGTTMYAIAAVDVAHAWATATGTLYLTTDGSHWTAPSTQYLSFGFSPVVAAGAPVTSVKATFEYKASVAPSAATETYLLVMPGNASTWTAYLLAMPTTSYQTVTTDISTLISTAAALQGVQVRFVVSQSNAFSTTTELVHLDVN